MKKQDYRVLFTTKTARVKAPYLDASVRYRCFNPAEVLDENGIQADVITQEELDIAFLERYDAFVFHRPDPVDAKMPLFVELAKARGKRVVADYDDLIFNPAYALECSIFKNGLADEAKVKDIFNRNYKGFSYFNSFTVSTEPLAEQVRALNPSAEVQVVPNGLSRKLINRYSHTEHKSAQRLKAPKRIFSYLSGTASHVPDFASIADVIQEILAKHRFVRFVVAGPMELPDFLENAPGIVRQAYKPFEEFFPVAGDFYANIAPLASDSVFNVCKSGLKFFESGIWGVPTIASPIPDFQRFSNSSGLLLPQTPEDWFEAFEKILDLEFYRTCTRGLREYCMEHCMADASAQTLLAFLQKGE